MDRRSKTLVILFCSAVAYGLVSNTIYPSWIKPLLTLDERIASAKKTLGELEEEEARIKRAKEEYLQYLRRNGSSDYRKVENELRSRLNAMIERHGLTSANVSGGGRATEDKKSGIARFPLEVTAEAALPAAVRFLKDLAEVPELVRVGNVRITRVTSSRASRDEDRVNFTVPLEVVVPPRPPILGRLDDSALAGVESFVRHQGRDYSPIWDRKPFTEYEPARPIVITIKQKNLSPKQGAGVTLQAAVSGGNGELKTLWSPPDGLSDPNLLNPRVVDTSLPGTRTFTLTVKDARGQTASDTVTVTVQEPQVARVSEPAPSREPPPPPAPPKPQAWPDGKFIQVRMALTTVDAGKRSDELMIYNNKTRTRDYYKAGDSFDGGELVLVHHRGGVGRRNNEYFLYPIGATLDAALTEDEGECVPELKEAAKRHRELLSSVTRGSVGANAEGDKANDVSPAVSAEVYGPMPPPDVKPVDSDSAANEKTSGGASVTGQNSVGDMKDRPAPPTDPPAPGGAKKRPPRRSGSNKTAPTNAPQPGADKPADAAPPPVPE